MALIEKSSLFRVNGKSDYSWTVTLVFKTGEAEEGVMVVLVFTSDFIVTESELLTV